ncbi:MAG: hypothetical protein J6M93_05405 [Succinivibrio sp.]|nr:hypothetical protein [Succinivibrio sp.]
MLLGYCSGAQAALSPHQVSSNPITGNYALEPHEFAGLGNGNTLTIDSTANVNLQGYFLAGGVPSGSSANSNVINTSGTAWSTGDNSSYGLVGGFFLGGALDAAEVSADENIINVTGGSISISPTSSGGLAAGVVYIMSADDENLSGSASGNKINISAGEIHTWVNGGFSYVKTGESSATSSASSNEVTVTGGTVSGEDRDYISGGMAYALSGNTSGTSNATAQNNRVVISGGSVQLTNVYGSYAYAACQTGNASASNNTVILGTGKYQCLWRFHRICGNKRYSQR